MNAVNDYKTSINRTDYSKEANFELSLKRFRGFQDTAMPYNVISNQLFHVTYRKQGSLDNLPLIVVLPLAGIIHLQVFSAIIMLCYGLFIEPMTSVSYLNRLRGSLPSEIKNLEVVNQLDLSQNQFSGDIPSSTGSMQSLVSLFFAHNKFQGSIPESLGNIRSLESLDLSYNNVSGLIPKSLETLNYLQYFDVSHNRLEGEIPVGGRFANFTAQSFLQNYALCSET
ncbi:putative LRR receptor-like serine/threonine-protein kinase [Forsythia ovata]|uniref:LRR receptor-like serine/threonine-protein kinase n=1 Tax=Forsythia ovata TaxID=205694 RepID=A0ABD1VN19_9LAMI